MIGCNCPVPAHSSLTRARAQPGRDSLCGEQRDIPGLVREWSNRNWEWVLLGRDSLEREQIEVPGPVWID